MGTHQRRIGTMFKHRLTLALIVIGALVLAACDTGSTGAPTATAVTSPPTATTQATTSGGKFKVAFVYVGPIGDAGWTWAHDQGRLDLQKNLPDIETAYLENVPETAADS